MEILICKIARNSYDSAEEFEHKLSFRITKYSIGFVFSTPNYSTGTWLNPVNAIRHYVEFCCKADEKSTYNDY